MNINGQNFTNFQNVRVKGTSEGATAPGALRFVATSNLESTLSINTAYQDSNFAWNLPAKSGLIGVSGTFTVNIPALAANAISQTFVVVSGLRAEDGFAASIMSGAYETAITTNRGVVALISARPSNTGIEMVFMNVSAATASGIVSPIIAYTAFR